MHTCSSKQFLQSFSPKISHLDVQVGSGSYSIFFARASISCTPNAKVINAPQRLDLVFIYFFMLKSQNAVNNFDTRCLNQKCLHSSPLQWSQPRRVVQSTTHKRERQEGCWGLGAWVAKYQHQNCGEILIHIVTHLWMLTSADVDPNEARPSGAVLHGGGGGVEGGSRL